MKNIFTIWILMFISMASYAQQQSESLASKVLSIYKQESLPYLEKFSSEKYKGQTDDLTKALIGSRYAFFTAKADYITKTVTKSLTEKEQQSDKAYVSKLAAFKYDQEFPGLPKEYWDAVNKRIKEL